MLQNLETLGFFKIRANGIFNSRAGNMIFFCFLGEVISKIYIIFFGGVISKIFIKNGMCTTNSDSLIVCLALEEEEKVTCV